MTLATFATPERTHTRTHAATRLVNYEGFDYESFWDEPGRRHLDALEHRVVAELLPARGRRILDLGCGFGRLTDVYVERFDEVVLVDLARSQLEVARERWGSRVTLIQADLLAPRFFPAPSTRVCWSGCSTICPGRGSHSGRSGASSRRAAASS